MSDTRQDLRGPMESDEIADGAVITPKIADGDVTTVKIGAGAVTQNEAPFAVDGFQDNQYLKEGVASGLATDVTGTQTLTVTLPSAYGTSLDGVLAFGEDLTDPTAEVDNTRIPGDTITASGFNIESDVKASGVSGSNASFRYVAWGRD